MTCPDIEVLLEAVLGETGNPQVQHHLNACSECGATARMVLGLRAAFRPDLRVSDELVERRVGLILHALSPRGGAVHDNRLRDVAVSSALALSTVFLTIVGTGSLGTTGLWGVGIMGVIAMIVAGAYERDIGRPPLDA